jgi:AGCS family alanine or glycine:cation symporter
MVGFGKFMGTFYAVGIFIGALGIGNMFQSNQAYVQLNTVSGGALDGYGWLVGLIMALVVFAVIIGGIKSIAKVTEKIVPFMAVFYCLFALVVIFMNVESLPQAISNIFTGAFTGEGVAGGALGAMIIGFQRAVFSNEAGIGSASIAHSAVQTQHPATEGYVALLEPFIDTVVICTMTSLVIIITGSWIPGDGVTGIALTARAFESSFSGFGYVLAIAAVLFAFSTMLSWSYYALKAWTYLFGEGKTKELIFKLIFCVFVVIGSSMSLGPVIDFSDAMIFAMAIANIIGLYMLMPKVKALLTDYQSKLASGEIKKVKG